ncbi:hypothetical protein U0070_000358 [Myodes glareolus]|uniref:Uncharacterized protein n=1 Tax=Myodes glareolus TaxID=447135 RepID=A0AAW0H9G5_MYOGA
MREVTWWRHCCWRPREVGTILTSVHDVGSKTYLTCILSSSSDDIVGHCGMRGGQVLQVLPDLQMQYIVDTDDRSGDYSCIFLPEHVDRGDIRVERTPRIKVGKKSEHSSEGENMRLVCKSESRHAPLITNGSVSKYIMISTVERSELTVSNLHINSDPSTYVRNATNTQGSVQERMILCTRCHLAALWPFLDIVVEVLVLVTIIFIYEKRQKPDQTLHKDDPGAAPLKAAGIMSCDGTHGTMHGGKQASFLSELPHQPDSRAEETNIGTPGLL